MNIISKFRDKEIKLNIEIPIKNANVSMHYLNVELKELLVEDLEINIENITDTWIEIEDKNIFFTGYNINKECYIKIDLSEYRDKILVERELVHKKIDEAFKNSYNAIIANNGGLLVDWSNENGFKILNTNPFNRYFLELENNMDKNKEIILNEYYRDEQFKIRIKTLLKLIAA